MPCTHSPFQFRGGKKQVCPVQNGNSRALVTGRSLFRCLLSGTVFIPTSDTVAPSHSSKLPLRPSSSLLPSSSYLDSQEDLRFPPPSPSHRLVFGLCVADLSVRARVTASRRDWGGGGRLSERKGYVIYNKLLTWYLYLAPLPAHPRLLFVCLLGFCCCCFFCFCFLTWLVSLFA